VEKFRWSVLLAQILALLLLAGEAAAQPSVENSATPEPQASASSPQPPAEEPAPAAPVSSPAVQPIKAGKALKVSYDKGIVFATEDGEFRTRLNLRNQLRFESTRPTEPGSEISNRIYIVRSRLQLEGNVFGEDNRYKLEFGVGDKGSFSFIKDLYIDKAAGPAWIRIGQWKRPFNRQEIVSDFTSQLNERANTADYSGGGRDLGIAIHNDYEKSPEGLEWVFGVFNTFNGGSDRPVIAPGCTQGMTGEITCTTPAPANFPADWGPTLIARVGWNSPGIKGYSEGDLEGGPLRYAVGASYKIDLADFDQGKESSEVRNMSHGLEADAMIKISGFSLELGAFMMKLKSADAGFGAMVQSGLFVVPGHGEVAARFGFVPTTGDLKQLELRGAFNWYWEGHRWKWATDVGLVKQTGSDAAMVADDPDYQLRSMAQLTF
jgi:hypothetical protein